MTALLAIAVLRSLIAAAIVIAILLMIVSAVLQPRETLGFFAFGLFAWALQNHFAAVAGLLALAIIFRRA